jgi:hypothetical protein
MARSMRTTAPAAGPPGPTTVPTSRDVPTFGGTIVVVVPATAPTRAGRWASAGRVVAGGSTTKPSGVS